MTRSRRMVLGEGESRLTAAKIADAAFDARTLLLAVLGCGETALRLSYEVPVTEAEQALYDTCICRRVAGEPLQYILGEWDFCGRSFAVFPGVLIPRPETEELTDRADALIKREALHTVYDLCAGTGCIGLTLALENPAAEVYLFELYDVPLRCIKKNKDLRNVENTVTIKQDILQAPQMCALPAPDLLVSNPPYIETASLAMLQPEVLREPLTALDGGADGLRFYKAIASLWYPVLRPGGYILLECAEKQAREICSFFPAEAQTDIYCDFRGQERFVFIHKQQRGAF